MCFIPKSSIYIISERDMKIHLSPTCCENEIRLKQRSLRDFNSVTIDDLSMTNWSSILIVLKSQYDLTDQIRSLCIYCHVDRDASLFSSKTTPPPL